MKKIPDDTPLNRMTLGQLKAALIGIMPQTEVKACSRSPRSVPCGTMPEAFLSSRPSACAGH